MFSDRESELLTALFDRGWASWDTVGVCSGQLHFGSGLIIPATIHIGFDCPCVSVGFFKKYNDVIMHDGVR